MFKCSKRSNIAAFVLNIREFDIRICFVFILYGCFARISIFGFCLNKTFRSGTIYNHILIIQNITDSFQTKNFVLIPILYICMIKCKAFVKIS